MKESLSVVGGIALAVAIGLGLLYGGIYLYRDTGPRIADAERNTYENSVSYVQGKAQELAKYKREYEAAKDETDRKALRGLILHTASTVDMSKMPAYLRTFVRDVERDK